LKTFFVVLIFSISSVHAACELKLPEGHVYWENTTCTFLTEEPNPCARLVWKHGTTIDHGASPVYPHSKGKDFCMSDKPIDLFGAIEGDGPQALLDCKSETSLELKWKGKSINCKFPIEGI
jgi:hypothetical protein